MNMHGKCKNCGADYALHHYETYQCPAFGEEAPVGEEQIWSVTTFEEFPAPKPARPTGPTLAYVRELEAEAVRVKAERDDFLNKADKIARKHVALLEQQEMLEARLSVATDALRRISAKCEEWQTEKFEREYPWWNLGDMAANAIKKINRSRKISAAANEAQP